MTDKTPLYEVDQLVRLQWSQERGIIKQVSESASPMSVDGHRYRVEWNPGHGHEVQYGWFFPQSLIPVGEPLPEPVLTAGDVRAILAPAAPQPELGFLFNVHELLKSLDNIGDPTPPSHGESDDTQRQMARNLARQIRRGDYK